MKRNTQKIQRIVEKHIGRTLFTNPDVIQYVTTNTDIGETVHHIDGDTENNNIENLYVFRTGSEHVSFHSIINRWARELMSMDYDERVEHLNVFPDLKSNLDDLKKITKDIDALWEYAIGFSSVNVEWKEFRPELSIDDRKRLLKNYILEDKK